MIGQRIDRYDVVEKLGAGGMGEVYRGRDATLGRDVAIKVLPLAFSEDRERVARFEREARALAALNHPNIAAIYEVERVGDRQALILELVEGETLAERIALRKSGLEFGALGIARQIAEALEAAHDKGIVHRDLKPANIKITPAGIVKVLDFGLAKLDEPLAPDASQSPTVTISATRAGVLLGTAAYMSPEQARARPVDKRTDIWAFGCVLYEMLAGRKTFEGATISDHIAAILSREPDWPALPASTPAAIQRLLRRCLEKDPKRRLHDIADARIEIDEALAAPTTMPTPTKLLTRSAPMPWPVAAIALIAVVALASWVVWRSAAPQSITAARPVMRFVVQPPPHVTMTGDNYFFDISQDSTQLVYEGVERGVIRLYLRRLDQLEATAIPGTEGGQWPFFSPDGASVGFWAGEKLKRVGVTAAVAPVAVLDIKGFPMASWEASDTIVFRRDIGSGLQRVSAEGGVAETITTLDESGSETDHHSPRMLPGGKALLFANHLKHNLFRVEVVEIATRKRKTLLDPGFDARYSPTGHLVFGNRHSLFGVRFDPDRLQLSGAPVRLLDDVVGDPLSGLLNFSLSPAGTLVYQSEPSRSGRTLVWTDRAGAETALAIAPRAFTSPRVSPDGKHLAFALADGDRRDIWIYDIAADKLTRVTREHDNEAPLWTPDGRRLTYTSIHDGRQHLVWQPADGSGPAETLVSSPDSVVPGAWTHDNRALLYVETPPTDNSEIVLLVLDGERKPRKFIHGSRPNRAPTVSPDGRWVAFASMETGRNEIYVDAFPSLGSRRQVTVDGGREPVWSRDGRQLLYRSDLSGTRIFAVAVDAAHAFSSGKPAMLFQGRYAANFQTGLDFDVAPDGRFLMIKPSEDELRPPELKVVVNWVDELVRRVPTGRR